MQYNATNCTYSYNGSRNWKGNVTGYGHRGMRSPSRPPSLALPGGGARGGWTGSAQLGAQGWTDGVPRRHGNPTNSRAPSRQETLHADSVGPECPLHTQHGCWSVYTWVSFIGSLTAPSLTHSVPETPRPPWRSFSPHLALVTIPTSLNIPCPPLETAGPAKDPLFSGWAPRPMPLLPFPAPWPRRSN